MLRRIFVALGVMLASFTLAGRVEPAELPTRHFLWEQDFEAEKDPTDFKMSEEDGTINFKGLTTERAFRGKRSYKLDVAFSPKAKRKASITWRVPIRVPAEGKLRFSCRFLVGKETNFSGGRLQRLFKVQEHVKLLPTSRAGGWASGFGIYPHDNGQEKWKLVEIDLVPHARNWMNAVVLQYVTGVSVKDGGLYLERIDIFLRGQRGKRVVVYIDDIKVEGEVPVEEAYTKEAKRRWAPCKDACEKKVNRWLDELKQRNAELDSLADLSEEARRLKDDAQGKIKFWIERLPKTRSREWVDYRDQLEILALLDGLRHASSNAQLLSAKQRDEKGVILYVVPPVTSSKILPSDSHIPGTISKEISLAACPGEYEPASFVVRALEEIRSLKVEVSALEGKNGVIPASDVDVRVVKCWYQGGTAWKNISASRARILVPELLLRDDSLVKVDTNEKHNYLNLHYADGPKYVCISEEDPKGGLGHAALPAAKFPVKDSPVLLPVDIPAGTNKQFWVTVKVPDDAGAGAYSGKIELKAQGRLLAKLDVNLRVLPFRLEPTGMIQSIYYTARLLVPDDEPYICSSRKTREQFKNEMENLFSHGVTNPTLSAPFSEKTKKGLGELLRIRNEVGMGNQPLYYSGCGVGNPTSQADLEALKNKIKEVTEFARNHGVPQVYFYGMDEAKGKRLLSQRKAWQAVHEAGGKIFVAGYLGHFELVGDLLDLLVCACCPQPREAAKWHRAGQKIVSYCNPQVGAENPELYRRNFGLLLWKINYDGFMNYAYQTSCGNTWNDFDEHPAYRFREHNFTYPTVNGVIDTIAWEGFREGVDDIRYARTLSKALADAKASGDEPKKKAISAAERWLEKLDVRMMNLDTVRSEMVNHILALRGK